MKEASITIAEIEAMCIKHGGDKPLTHLLKLELDEARAMARSSEDAYRFARDSNEKLRTELDAARAALRAIEAGPMGEVCVCACGVLDCICHKVGWCRGRAVSASCTGTLIHDEFTPCPVHDK